ncbi:MAG: pyrroline-5-carboxylate reductase [Mycoplasma sp.]|nr:pyrroline-5-carboxylate reductase [Mycoplasma sp.]
MMNKKIGIIGLGTMGQSIIKGLSKNIDKSNIIGCEILEENLKKAKSLLEIEVTNDSLYLVNNANIIFLAIRPNQIKELIESIKKTNLENKIFISIVSGITILNLEEYFNLDYIKIVRTMPNINVQYNLSATAICFNKNINDNEKQLVQDIWNILGKSFVIEEHLFSTFAVVAGTTPAYFFKLVDSLYKAGVKYGLDPEVALKSIIQVGLGSFQLLKNSPFSPKELVQQVATPGGLTIEGIGNLEKHNFDDLIDESVNLSIEKDKKLV